MSGHTNGWIAVDFDGTLVEYENWVGPTHIGAAIMPMVQRVRRWLAEGKDVRIFTARVYAPPDDYTRQCDAALAMLKIQDWCFAQFQRVLPITCVKDFGMYELWDDRCVQLDRNTGLPVVDRVRAEVLKDVANAISKVCPLGIPCRIEDLLKVMQ